MAFVRFTIRQLEAFVAVHEAAGFGAAAQRLALSTSAVSQLVSELEDVLGFRLFDRDTRHVCLTAVGGEFLASARAVLSQLEQAARAASELSRRDAGQVCIAAPQVLAATLLPEVIEAFARTRPGVHLSVRDTPVDQLVDAVCGAQADLAIGPDLSAGGSVQRETLFDSPWVLWCAPTHPLAAVTTVRWPELRQHRVVAAGRDHERSVPAMSMDSPVAERIVPNEVVDHVTTALGLSARGLAVTLAPAYVMTLAQSMGLVMRPVVEPQAMRQVCLYRPLRRTLSAPAADFAAHVATWVQLTGSTTFTCPVPEATKYGVTISA